MLEFNTLKIRRILNPTAIDLGDYVINPFMGCEFACLYCYVRSNQVVSKKNKPWGEYVDIRVNAPHLLEKEIIAKRPRQVLLGSTTECFQPIEKECQLTKQILEILNKNKVYYVILTRSPLITNYIPLLKEGFCRQIYFTVNNYAQEFKMQLEPRSPAFNLRDKTVNLLLEEEIPVIPYFSPLLPWISKIDEVFFRFTEAEAIEFECLNLRLGNIAEVINNIASVEPGLRERYEKMLLERIFYNRVWMEIKKGIERQAKKAKKRYNIYIHH